MKSKLFLKVDNRENKCIELIGSLKDMYAKNIEYTICPLNIGDFILCKTNNIETHVSELNETEYDELIIYERKSLNDLASSIKDGRYAEQSTRLDSLNIHNHNIVYIIEGNMDNFSKHNRYTKMPVSTLYSSMVSILSLKGFSLVRTFSVIETVSFLLQSFNKLQKELCQNNKSLYFTNTNHLQPQYITTDISHSHPEKNCGGISIQVPNIESNNNVLYDTTDAGQHYVSKIKKIKKENITPENIGEIILSQIPGISTATSLAIMNKAGSLYNLIQQLSNNDEYLNDIRMKSKSGVERKISRKAIDSIKSYILYGCSFNKITIDV